MMVNVEVSKAICDIGTRQIENSNITISEMLNLLSQESEVFRRNVFTEENEISSHILIFVNSSDYRAKGGADYVLNDNDDIKILALLGGG
ncbi:MoaD/ThiS family protein [Ruminiclostridium papyrosolvens DSM 2782]|nr:MoaD/ThiS family protein [Ruminiclostridium papyrosolvens]WES33580.1 MoaD/ThiS family protein [Ruminiclostridium papyrosolvens DSM 2782]